MFLTQNILRISNRSSVFFFGVYYVEIPKTAGKEMTSDHEVTPFFIATFHILGNSESSLPEPEKN